MTAYESQAGREKTFFFYVTYVIIHLSNGTGVVGNFSRAGLSITNGLNVGDGLVIDSGMNVSERHH